METAISLLSIWNKKYTLFITAFISVLKQIKFSFSGTTTDVTFHWLCKLYLMVRTLGNDK